MENAIKIESFQYLVKKLVDWHREATGKDENDLSVLKTLKLMFFVTTASLQISRDDSLLDSPFDRFVAMPFGPVESDIYDEIKLNSGNLGSLSIDNKQAKMDLSNPINENLYSKKIDNAIDKLKEINYMIIAMRPFDLVDLSHKWFSWQKSFQEARNEGKSSKNMDISDIKNDRQVYFLSPFL
jgi:uncharacterized phage-associated protein